jgi:aldose sugar dehydrogenase
MIAGPAILPRPAEGVHMHALGKRLRAPIVAAAVIVFLAAPARAQLAPDEVPGTPPQPGIAGKDTLPDGPQVFNSRAQKFRVVPIKGLERPFSIAFLPDGRMLITERPGRLRIVRDGVLDPTPVSGIPPVLDRNLKGLQDLALHPKFAENKLVYFAYYKPKPGETDVATATLARGRFDGDHALTDVRDIFVSDAWCASPSAARIAFGRDGTVFFAIGVPIRGRAGTSQPEDSQAPFSDVGKILRLNDDGTIPQDNPFVHTAGYKPEIYAMGIRNILGMAINPQTGELWEHENGPQGGDEINIVKPGRNYGWPVISYGRAYTGERTGGTSGPLTSLVTMPGMEDPILVWLPSIAPSGLAFYTGEQFPGWKGNIFVGGMRSMLLQRIVMNDKGVTLQENLLTDLKQRIRDVRQGPDGLLYVLTDENKGALLRIEPVVSEPRPKTN